MRAGRTTPGEVLSTVVRYVETTLARRTARTFRITASSSWSSRDGRRVDIDDTKPMSGQGPSHNYHFLSGVGQWLQSDLVGLQQGSGTAFSHPLIAPRIVNHTDLL